MKHAAIASVLVVLTATSAAAQGKSQKGKIPPGHVPPAGMCRVWHDGVPPGRQPRPTSCSEAEREAARTGARVIYADGRSTAGQGGAGGGILGRDRDGRIDRRLPDDRRSPDGRAGTDRRRPTVSGEPRGRAIPRAGRVPSAGGRVPSTRGGVRLDSSPAQSGYSDGLLKGREDAADGDSFDPNRHSWYRSADRGYSNALGSRDQYRDAYRRGFVEGYLAGFGSTGRSGGAMMR